MKMVAARVGLSEPPIGDRVEAEAFWVAFDPDKQSGPRCIEVIFFVAPGNGEHVWQCLELTCGVTVAFRGREARCNGQPYTSGVLTTLDKFYQTYGYFEERA